MPSEKAGVESLKVALLRQSEGLKALLEADAAYRQEKAAFLWRMRRINAQSPETDFQEKLRWLRGLGKIEQIQKLLDERQRQVDIKPPI